MTKKSRKCDANCMYIVKRKGDCSKVSKTFAKYSSNGMFFALIFTFELTSFNFATKFEWVKTISFNLSYKNVDSNISKVYNNTARYTYCDNFMSCFTNFFFVHFRKLKFNLSSVIVQQLIFVFQKISLLKKTKSKHILRVVHNQRSKSYKNILKFDKSFPA